MSGEVVHFTIPADQPDRARRFYSTVFGWKMTEIPGADHTMVSTGPVDERGMPKTPGFVGGSIGKRGAPLASSVVWIMVDDITVCEREIEQHGGTIIQRKQAMGDGSMGYFGYFKDCEGNVVALFQLGKGPS